MRALSLSLLIASPVFAQEVVPPPVPTPVPQAPATAAIGVRVDCLHDFNRDKGSSQSCASITGVRYTATQVLSPQVLGRLRLDPFAPVDSSRADTSLRDGLKLVRDTDFVLVDDYAIVWTPRPNLEVAMQSYGGAATLPSTSGLALANGFSEAGWKQSALTLTYLLTAFNDMRVKFAFGNGEGENGENLDPQQYFGFEIDAMVLPGLRAGVGVSFDGNDHGSEAHDWMMQQYATDCGFAPPLVQPERGFSTQRLAARLVADGVPGADGLRVGIGWQRNVMSDLDKTQVSGPSAEDLGKCTRLDPGSVLVEDAPGSAVNTVQRTIYGISASYELFGDYFFGADYTTRRVDTGSVKLFGTCSGFTGRECSVPSGASFNNLSQNAFTVGGGVHLAEGLVLTLEYNKTDLDRKYAQVYYLNQNDKTLDSIEYFNGRIAYNWR